MMKQKCKKILSLVLAVTMLLSLTVTAFAADTSLTPREQVRQNEVIGTAYLGNGVMPLSADGTNANISIVRDIPYADYHTNVFSVQTESGTYTGYCAEPRKKAMEGTYAIATLENDTIKRLLLSGPGGPCYEMLKDSLFAFLDWDTAFADTHASIGYVYTGDTTGMDDSYLDGILNQINAVAGDHPIARVLDGWVNNYTVKIAYNDVGQDIVWMEENPKGNIEIQKSSSNPSITNGNACYSLEGAVYQLLDGNGGVAATLTTDANGYARADGIAPGNYTLKEVTAPKGYLLDDTSIPVTITTGQTTSVPVTDKPGNDPAAIFLQKVDKDTGDVAQAEASLAGAQFTVKYYDGYYEKSNLPANATRTWVIETKEIKNPQTGEKRYYARLNDEYKISGDELYYGNGGVPTLPLGTITIQETKAPDGYLLEGAYLEPIGGGQRVEGIYLSHITQNGNMISMEGGNEYTMTEFVVRGGVKIQKFDKDTEATTPQGDATLAGAKFDIINLNDGPVSVNGKTYASGETVLTLTTDENGLAQTAADTLPAGHYKVKEITPPNGYLQEGILEREFDITQNGVVVDLTAPANGIQNEVIKGSILIVKHTDNGETGIETPEVGAEFQVYLKSAGRYEAAKETERDTITCDEDGFAQTKELPYGTYVVHQTKGWPGRDMVDDFEVYIGSDGQVYRFIINNKNFESYLKVIKADAETGKTIPYAGAGFQIYDPEGNLVKMKYTYPVITEVDTFYTAEDGTLMTPERLPYGTGYKLVEVQAPHGYVLDSTPVEFDVIPEDADVEDGYTIIRITKGDQPQKGTITVAKTGEIFSGVVTREEDGKTIYQPVWETGNLPGAVFEIRAAENIKTPDGTLRYAKKELVDTITTGADGTATSKALYLGKYTVAEVTAPDGMVLNKEPKEVELTYAGQDISIIETGVELENDRQKVEVTLTKTMEEDELFGYGGKEELADIRFGLYAAEDIPAADGTVIPADGLLEILAPGEDGSAKALTDLPPGSYYIQEAATNEAYILGDAKYPVVFEYAGQDTALVEIAANDGEAIENELIRGTIVGNKRDYDNLGVPGALIGLFAVNTEYFTAETALMTAVSDKDGIFSFDEVPYGTYLVRELEAPEGYLLNETVYEVTVTEDGAEVPVDIVDWEVPVIHTTLIDAKTDTKNVLAEMDMELIDEVYYEDLIPGQTYLIRGILMDKADETGNTPILVDGKEVVSSLIFTPEEREGTVEVSYRLDGSGLKGKTMVAYEQLFLPRYGVENPDPENPEDWVMVTAHEDMEDGAQTVYVPEIGTTLTTISGEHEIEAGGMITLTDRVHYENLIPGETYRMDGILMDRETGGPLMIDGKPVESSVMFVPTEPEGYVEITFTFNSSELGGKYLVAFETLCIGMVVNPNPEKPGDWEEVGNHQDLKDEGQTVYVKKPVEPAKTGDDRNLWILTGVCLIGAGGALYFYSLSRNKKKKRKEIGR